jgi:hypothetical protein
MVLILEKSTTTFGKIVRSFIVPWTRVACGRTLVLLYLYVCARVCCVLVLTGQVVCINLTATTQQNRACPDIMLFVVVVAGTHRVCW